jgi:hypothetical protein
VADTQQQNELIKICFDGNKHLKHVLSMQEINQMTMIENRFPLTKLPVCGSCERLAYWGKGMQGICKHCGTITKAPITYSSYLAAGYDVDPTGATARSVMINNEFARKELMPEYHKLEELLIARR